MAVDVIAELEALAASTGRIFALRGPFDHGWDLESLGRSYVCASGATAADAVRLVTKILRDRGEYTEAK